MALVYKATNQVNGKRYIGATKRTLKRRSDVHKSDAIAKRPGCRVFNAAIRKYGAAAFVWEVLSEHETLDAALAEEVRVIAAERPEYNITAGGSGASVAHDPEWNAKISRAHLGTKKPWAVQLALKLSAASRGIKRPPEVGARISAALTGKPRPSMIGNTNARRKPIICLNDDKIYEHAGAAAAAYGIARDTVMSSCSGRPRRRPRVLLFAYVEAFHAIAA